MYRPEAIPARGDGFLLRLNTAQPVVHQAKRRPVGLSRASALSSRSSNRCSARLVNMR